MNASPEDPTATGKLPHLRCPKRVSISAPTVSSVLLWLASISREGLSFGADCLLQSDYLDLSLNYCTMTQLCLSCLVWFGVAALCATPLTPTDYANFCGWGLVCRYDILFAAVCGAATQLCRPGLPTECLADGWTDAIGGLIAAVVDRLDPTSGTVGQSRRTPMLAAGFNLLSRAAQLIAHSFDSNARGFGDATML